MQGRRWIEHFLPVLSVGAAIDFDQQSSAQAGDSDRGRQMIDGRGSKQGEPNQRKAGASFRPNRPSARSTWTVSKKPNR